MSSRVIVLDISRRTSFFKRDSAVSVQNSSKLSLLLKILLYINISEAKGWSGLREIYQQQFRLPKPDILCLSCTFQVEPFSVLQNCFCISASHHPWTCHSLIGFVIDLISQNQSPTEHKMGSENLQFCNEIFFYNLFNGIQFL